jgi:Cof subfamily protein (haloacid dehalogenase superfamily)
MPPCQSGCPRILACDLDGTLLNGKGVLTEATAAALRKAVASGVEVVFATGRRHSFAWKMLAPLGLDPETVLISSNGAISRTFGGRTLDRIGMPVETALQLCSQLNDFRNSLVFTFDRTGRGALVVENIAALHARLSRWVESNLDELESVLPLERAFDGGEEPVQAMICGTLAVMSEGLAMLDAETKQAENLRKIISIHRTEYPARDLSIVDLMPNGCSKGSALARLAASRGVDAADIVAIGDNMNDAEMLAYVGRAVVMENSPAELLAMAAENGWTVTGSNEFDGAAQAILRMLEEDFRSDRGRRGEWSRRLPTEFLEG